MVKTVKVISAFVASPSDVIPERQVLTRVMNELNLVWSAQFEVQLEIVRWETHSRPAAGTDPQSVINNQIVGDCDVFIGILWSRIGSPTPRGISGTVEEFERTYDRSKTDPGCVEIMMYFKQAAIPPDQIDPDQLKQLRDFKQRLQGLGILHCAFNDTAEFEQLVRVHLGKVLGRVARGQVQDIGGLTAIQTAEQRASAQSPIDIDDPDIGFLDLEEIFEEAGKTVVAGMEEITAATDYIAKGVSEAAANLQTATNARTRKNIFELVASRCNEYAGAIEKSLPGVREAQQRMALSGARRITLFADSNGPQKDVEVFSSVVTSVVEKIATTHFNTAALRNAVAQTPRATVSMNQAKRRLLKALDDLLEFYVVGQKLFGAMRDAARPPNESK